MDTVWYARQGAFARMMSHQPLAVKTSFVYRKYPPIESSPSNIGRQAHTILGHTYAQLLEILSANSLLPCSLACLVRSQLFLTCMRCVRTRRGNHPSKLSARCLACFTLVSGLSHVKGGAVSKIIWATNATS